jgi:putative hydrolase of the HAD superfamily
VSRVEAVISDFGGVLTTPLFNAFAHLQEEQGVSLEALGKAMWAVTQDRGENPLFPLERGEMTEREFMGLVGAALSAEVGRPVAMEDFGERYFARLEPNAAMIDYLRSLRDRGVRLAMLTNNVREWEPRWRAMLPVDELFELVVDSAFVGLRKPDPAIYELTLERLGLAASACAFVDDLEHNCTAAGDLGIRAVRFLETDQAIAELDALFDR